MFESMVAPAKDAILSLMAIVNADTREDIINLTVGVYRDDSGATPVLNAVREAEKRLVMEQETKSYKGLVGDPGFSEYICQLVLGDNISTDKIAMSQTPGGSGALRVLSELIRIDQPDVTLWLSDPTWANHHPLLGSVGLKRKVYPYFDISNQSVRFEDLLASVEEMQAGEVMVLHGCCHNPTGCDLSSEQWTTLADIIASRGVVPLIDLAYHGLGDGLEADVAGVRCVAAKVPVAMISVSCSKNFGVYRDRVGCAIVTTPAARMAQIITAQLGAIARTLYSMPPDHGASVIKMILGDDELRSNWINELISMQSRVQRLRVSLAASLVRQSGDSSWDFIVRQKGMFSLLGTSDHGIEQLRDDHAVYLVGGGRINIAGLRDQQIDRLAAALIAVS